MGGDFSFPKGGFLALHDLLYGFAKLIHADLTHYDALGVRPGHIHRKAGEHEEACKRLQAAIDEALRTAKHL